MKILSFSCFKAKGEIYVTQEEKETIKYSEEYYLELIFKPHNWSNPIDMDKMLKVQRNILLIFGILEVIVWGLGKVRNNFQEIFRMKNILFFMLSYAFINFLLMYLYWWNFKRVWERTEKFDNSNVISMRILKILIMVWNVVWIASVIVLKKILDKNHMEIIFENGFYIIASSCIAMVLDIVVISCMAPFLKAGLEILKNSILNANIIGVWTYLNLLIFFFIIMFRIIRRKILYLLIKIDPSRKTVNEEKLLNKISGKLDIITLIVLWVADFLLGLGKYTDGTFIYYFTNGLLYSSALLTAWIPLKVELSKP